MKTKNSELAEQHIKQIFEEEVVRALKEEIEAGRINPMDLDEKSTLGHLGSAAKGYGKLVSSLFHNFAKTLDVMMNQGMIPDEVADKVEDRMDDIGDDLKDPKQQGDAIGDLEDLMRATSREVDKAGADKASDKIDDLADKAEDVEDKLSDSGGEGKGSTENDEKVKAAVLDLIDATNEKWDQIMKATSDKNLKKSMEYMEKVALAERLMKEIRRQIHEMSSQNQSKTLINSEKVER